jgi:hypothetical protein
MRIGETSGKRQENVREKDQARARARISSTTGVTRSELQTSRRAARSPLSVQHQRILRPAPNDRPQ